MTHIASSVVLQQLFYVLIVRWRNVVFKLWLGQLAIINTVTILVANFTSINLSIRALRLSFHLIINTVVTMLLSEVKIEIALTPIVCKPGRTRLKRGLGQLSTIIVPRVLHAAHNQSRRHRCHL